MSLRFDSEERLELWQRTGRFPDIHDDLFTTIEVEAEGDSFLDLCCSTGLLGQRLLSAGRKAVGVEMDERTIALGKRYGVQLEVTQLAVTVDTFDVLGDVLKRNGVNVLVARRCLSEIFFRPVEREQCGRFADMLCDAGVKEVFLQGRQYTPKASHPVPSIKHEVALLDTRFVPRFIHGEISYLRIK